MRRNRIEFIQSWFLYSMSRIYVKMTRVSFGRFPDAPELRIKLLGTFYGCLVSKLFLLHEIHFPSRYLDSKLKVTELRGIISWSTGRREINENQWKSTKINKIQGIRKWIDTDQIQSKEIDGIHLIFSFEMLQIQIK